LRPAEIQATRKPQKRSAETRDAIKRAGAELFATKGYRSTGVRDIADAAGCNQALIAYHFGGKGGLYDEILGDAVAHAKSLAAEAELLGDPAPERRLVQILAKALSSQSHLAPMILREQMDPDRLLNVETANSLRGFMALTESVLDALSLDDEARGWDPQIVHLAVVGPLIHFLVATRMRDAVAAKVAQPMSTPSIDEFAETLASMVSRSLRGGST
jgi:AcrR family transcriptional regulator